ncbi:hypothetical protein ACTJJM_05485 [Stenotrophomonas sp. 22692]|uniref:hypothetical protein n=1 Tax=Stenotrophomonas sp. 22692 TaxID=3453956 RepID=UPI003F879B0A
MSNGISMVVPGPFTDASLPISSPDPIVVPGSLLLARAVDLEGVTHGSTVTNVAAAYAEDLTGVDSSLGLVLSVSPEVAPHVERTPKKGLHVAVSQSSALPSGSGASLVLPSWLIQYVLNNPTHIYYVSMWQWLTRQVVGTGNSLGYTVVKPAGGAFDHLLAITNTGALGSNIAGYMTGNALGMQMLNEAAGNNGITNVGGGDGFRAAARWGRLSPLNTNAADQLRLPSYIWYGTYMEDLTASGRTYNQVRASDVARMNAEIVTDGGLYFGDSFTPPASLAP